jgi:hypothetical protein
MRSLVTMGLSLLALTACGLDFDSFGFAGQGGAGADAGAGGTGGSPTGSGASGGTGGTGGMATGGMGTGATGAGGMATGGMGAGGMGAGGMGGKGGMGGNPPTGIFCPDANNLCDVQSGAACCWNNDNQTATCEANGSCNDSSSVLGCMLPSDCPGQVCCGDFDFSEFKYLGASCENSCNAPGAVVLCNDTNDCGMFESCMQSQALPMGYKVCI